MCATATSSSSFRSTTAADDDFVDLECMDGGDVLAGMLEEDNRPILGVTRLEAEKENEKRSRLGMKIVKEDRFRSGSRAYNHPSSDAGVDAIPVTLGEDGDSASPTEDEDGQLRLYVDEDCNAVEGSTEGARLRDGRTLDHSLPFDDAGMAETILRMEVEGQIDETWQDARRANFEDCQEIVNILKHMKVRDVACIQTSAKTGSFDYLIIGTCEGSRHLNLCAWSVSDADKEHRVSKVRRRKDDNNWEVVPVGRIVVNLMTESLRSEMSLERKWAVTKSMDPLDSANAPISEGRQVKAHGLWTLTLNLQDLEDFEVDYCKDALLSQL